MTPARPDIEDVEEDEQQQRQPGHDQRNYGGDRENTVAKCLQASATPDIDEILNNETKLPVLEHTTDTAGYTEVVFALFDLLGLQFSPRIRDLADQQLYPTSSVNLENYPNLKNHLPHVINKERIFLNAGNSRV